MQNRLLFHYPAMAKQLQFTQMSRDSSEALVGTTIGSFRITKVLGRGGMGTVYLGEHAIIRSRVAIKILQERLASDESLVARFYAEARAVNMIGHDNIVSVFDMNVIPPNRYYLVMEYLDGNQLNSLLTGPVAAEIAIPILLQVCDALQAAHDAGVVHRDLKPENIFLLKRNKRENFVKVLDFGLAKLLDTNNRGTETAAGLIVGTPEFMSPEQANSQPVDGRSDIYSLGCIAWLMAVGQLPFNDRGLTDLLVAHRSTTPKAPHQINAKVPVPWSQAIMRAMEKDPSKRFQTAREFAEALDGTSGTDVTPTPILLSSVKPDSRDLLRSSEFNPYRPPEVRFTSRFLARVDDLSGRSFGTLECHDISKGGMFLASSRPVPAIFSRVAVTIPSANNLTVLAEVVRHVPQEQAKAWNMTAGFGVRFVEVTPEVREALARLIEGLPSDTKTQPPEMNQAVFADAMAKWRDLMNGDHYVVLDARHDAEMAEIQAKATARRQELDHLKMGVQPRQRVQIEAARARVEAAIGILGDPISRARFDANRGNYQGVAKCVVVGLGPLELEGLRQEQQRNHPNTAGAAHVKFLASKGFEAQGQLAAACDACEAALRLDPLNLQLHERLGALSRALHGR